MGSHFARPAPVVARRGLAGTVGLALIAALAVGAVYIAVSGGEPPPQDDGAALTDAAAPDTVVFAGWGESLFDHEMHWDALEMPCEDCHHETNASALALPHQEYFEDFWIDCQICHKPGGDVGLDPTDCAECHHDSPTGITDETLSAKVVIHKSCAECHDIGTGPDASESCSTCHDAFPN